jgi:hypothetical protein
MIARHPRFLAYPLAAVLLAVGAMMGLGTAAGASTTSAASANSAAATAAAKGAIEHLLIGQHGANHTVSTSTQPGAKDAKSAKGANGLKGLTQVDSTNWAGYADTGSSFSHVSATWTEPTPSCSGSRSEQLAAFWVGIDGFNSSSVEQDGTLIECFEGSTFQYTWWELFPTNDIQVVGESVAAGDSITASVTRSGTSYTLAVTDATHTANSFSTTQTSSGDADSSAEWIAEAPSSGSTILPLAHFSTWTASNASVTEGSTAGTISSFTDDELTMDDSSGAIKAESSSLNAAGNSFAVTWERSS